MTSKSKYYYFKHYHIHYFSIGISDRCDRLCRVALYTTIAFEWRVSSAWNGETISESTQDRTIDVTFGCRWSIRVGRSRSRESRWLAEVAARIVVIQFIVNFVFLVSWMIAVIFCMSLVRWDIEKYSFRNSIQFKVANRRRRTNSSNGRRRYNECVEGGESMSNTNQARFDELMCSD